MSRSSVRRTLSRCNSIDPPFEALATLAEARCLIGAEIHAAYLDEIYICDIGDVHSDLIVLCSSDTGCPTPLVGPDSHAMVSASTRTNGFRVPT